jgi:hypothetical protein
LFGRIAVEISGRFVGQDDAWIVHQASSDRDALLLPAGKVDGEVVFDFSQADQIQEFVGSGDGFFRNWFLRDAVRHQDVFQCGEFGKQIMELEDESDRLVAKLGQLILGHIFGVDAVDDDLTVGRNVEGAKNVEKRAFPGSGLADDGIEGAFGEAKIDAEEHLRWEFRLLVVDFGDALKFDDVVRHCGSPR